MRRLLRDRHAVILLLILLGSSIGYFNFRSASGEIGSTVEFDGYYYYVYLRSVQVDGDIDFTNEYRDWANPFKFGPSPTGRARNIFGPGPALLWAPFFLATHLVAHVGARLGYPLSLDGLSRFHQVGTLFGSLLFGWLALVFSYLVARKLFGREHALWAALGAALAGPLPFYAVKWGSYSHAHAAMAASLLVLLWLEWRGEWSLRRWCFFGAAAGLLLLVRPAAIAFALLPIFEAVRTLVPALRARDLRAAARAASGPLLGAVAAIVVFSPQLIAWRLIFGHFLTTPQGEGFMRWRDSAWLSVLFSPRDGLLVTAPLMGVALLGLFASMRRLPSIGGPLLLVFAAALYVNGAAYDFWGWGFSSRRMTTYLPLFAIGLGVVLSWVRARMLANPARAIAWVTSTVIGLFVVFNFGWMLCYVQQNLSWYFVRSSQGLYMSVLHRFVDGVYGTVGNPLSLPTSLAFTLRKGGTPKVYDRIDGSFLLGESHEEANPAALQSLNSNLDMGDLRFKYFLSESFGTPVRVSGIRFVPLREPRGHVFLPINRPGPVDLLVVGQAAFDGTTVELRFNGEPLRAFPLPRGAWSKLEAAVPARLVERGINRLDLVHGMREGWSRPTSRRVVGRTGVVSPVDIAVVSGGHLEGNFAEVWVDEKKVSDGYRGLNVAVVDPRSGRVRGARGFDTVWRAGEWMELAGYLAHFPRGSLVALGARDNVSKFWSRGGARAMALLGAHVDLSKADRAGYAVIGVLGAPAGSALEAVASSGHARVLVGFPPPPWREVARYRLVRLQ
jgi:hypothetical protein